MKTTNLAIKLNLIKQQVAQWQEMQREIEDELIELLSEEKSVDLEDVRITRVESNRVSYSIEKMKLAFGKEKLNELCSKEINVDKAELRDLLAQQPKFKKILSNVLKISFVPDEDKIKKALEKGSLSDDELREFASVKTSVYIKTTKREQGENE